MNEKGGYIFDNEDEVFDVEFEFERIVEGCIKGFFGLYYGIIGEGLFYSRVYFI